ncbi:MAG: DUF481 domain-containing protein [Pseudomonadales bacterium]
MVRGIFAAWLLFCAGFAQAADFVVMKNGDRITGEIEKIWNGEVFIEPEYGDTYAVEMEHVAYIHTDEPFEVEFRRGRHTETVLGRLDLDGQGRPVVQVEDSETTYPVSQIDNMLEVEDFFDWGVRSDISVNVSTGNSQTSNGRVFIHGDMKLGEHRHVLEYTRDASKADGSVTKNQTEVYYEDMWTFREEWFVRGSVTWTRDPVKDLDSRSQFFAGPGYHIFDDSKRTLNLSFGPNLLVEEISGEHDESLSVLGSIRYEQKFFDDDLVLFQQTDYQAVVEGRKNKILSTKTGMRLDLPKDMYVNLEIDYDHESDPAEGRQQDDVTYLVGFGIDLD